MTLLEVVVVVLVDDEHGLPGRGGNGYEGHDPGPGETTHEESAGAMHDRLFPFVEGVDGVVGADAGWVLSRFAPGQGCPDAVGKCLLGGGGGGQMAAGKVHQRREPAR